MPTADDLSFRCVDCFKPLTPTVEPKGVIFIRTRIEGRWHTAPICSADYEARRLATRAEEPTRVLHGGFLK